MQQSNLTLIIFATSTKDRSDTSVLPWVTFGHSSGPKGFSDIHLSCKESQDTQAQTCTHHPNSPIPDIDILVVMLLHKHQ